VDELGATASKETIAARLGTGRTPAAVQEHWRVMHAPRTAGAAPAQSETIRIPAGAKPGQELRVSLASGKVVFVRVPPNVAPGHLLKVVNGPPPASAAPLPVATPADMAALAAVVAPAAAAPAAAAPAAAAAKPIELPTPVPPPPPAPPPAAQPAPPSAAAPAPQWDPPRVLGPPQVDNTDYGPPPPQP
jgi:hypothetical protein